MEAIFDTSFQNSDVVDIELDFGLTEDDINRLIACRTKTFAVMARFIDQYNVQFFQDCGVFFYGVHPGDPHPVEKWLLSYMTQHMDRPTKVECMMHFIIPPTGPIRVETVTTMSQQFDRDARTGVVIKSKNWNIIEKPIRSSFDGRAVAELCQTVETAGITLRELLKRRDYVNTLNRMRHEDAFVKMVLC